MHLTPDTYITKYRSNGLPFYKIFAGGSTSEKSGKVMDALVKKPDDMTDSEFLEYGAQKLQEFFDLYDDGFVTIVAKSHPRNGDDRSITNSVKWGKASGSMPMPQKEAVNGFGFGGLGQMKQMLELMAMVQGLTKGNDTTEMQLKLLQKQHESEMAALKKQVKWEREREELIGALQGEPPSMGETLTQELISLIRPVATSMLANKAAPAALPVVNGMESMPKKKVAKTPTPLPTSAEKPQQHCMMNMSLDQTLVCVRHIMTEVFPDYNVNEVMPALATMCGQHKDIIRQFVTPTIDANRQTQAGKPAHSVGTFDDEEE